MTSFVEQTTLHSNVPGSDKLYWAGIEEFEGGYVVNFWYGARLGGHQTTGCKTVNPKNKKEKRPVSLDQARKIYKRLLDEKRNGSSLYHAYPVCGHGGNGASAEVHYTAPETAEPTGRKLDCQLFTELDDAQRAADLLISPGIVAQQKMDGKRIRLLEEGMSVTGFNRSNKACAIPSTVIEDAKRFNGLGPLLIDGETIGDTFWAFDLLEVGGVDVRQYAFKERDEQLAAILKAASLQYIRRVPTEYTADGKVALCAQLHADKMEGIMLKRADAPYLPGRQRDQFKHKFTTTASFVVIKVNERNSVNVGLFENGKLIDCGNCTIRSSAFNPQPGMVLEIKYLYAFPDSKHIYQPRMIAVRDDIRPEECLLSQLKFKGKQK